MNTGRCKMHPVHLLMPVIVIALCAGAYPVLDGAVCTVNANAPNGRMRVVPSADVPPGANVASSFAAEDNWAAALKKKTDIPERKFGMLVVDELTQRTGVAGHPRSKGQRDVDGGGAEDDSGYSSVSLSAGRVLFDRPSSARLRPAWTRLH